MFQWKCGPTSLLDHIFITNSCIDQAKLMSLDKMCKRRDVDYFVKFGSNNHCGIQMQNHYFPCKKFTGLVKYFLQLLSRWCCSIKTHVLTFLVVWLSKNSRGYCNAVYYCCNNQNMTRHWQHLLYYKWVRERRILVQLNTLKFPWTAEQCEIDRNNECGSKKL